MPPSKSFSLSHLLRFYFDFAFVFLISPFRIVQLEHKEEQKDYQEEPTPISYPKFQLRSCFLQKLLCFAVTLLDIFWMFGDIRRNFPQPNTNNPTGYFRSSYWIFSGLLKVLTFKSFWFHEEDYIRILNFLDYLEGSGNENTLKLRYKWLTWKPLVILWCGFMSAVEVSGILQEILTLGLENWWGTMIQRGYYNFFIENATVPVPGKEGREWDSVVVGVLSSIAFFQRKMMASYPDLLLQSTSLIFWISSKSFSHFLENDYIPSYSHDSTTRMIRKYPENLKNLQSQSSRNWNLRFEVESAPAWLPALEIFEDLKRLTSLLNNVTGDLFTFFLVSRVVFYAIAMDDLLSWGNFPERSRQFRLIFYSIYGAILLYLAADACEQVSFLKTWINEAILRGKPIPLERLILVINQIRGNTVSLQASRKFSITFCLLSNITSVTVTYFVVCIQADNLAI